MYLNDDLPDIWTDWEDEQARARAERQEKMFITGVRNTVNRIKKDLDLLVDAIQLYEEATDKQIQDLEKTLSEADFQTKPKEE